MSVKEFPLPEVAATCVSMCRTGSRYTCDPAPADTDDDWLLMTNNEQVTHDAIYAQGFDDSGSSPGEFFTSFYRESDRLNLIVTCKAEFYAKFAAATSVAKRLNLLRKDDRIAMFRAVLYAENCEPAEIMP